MSFVGLVLQALISVLLIAGFAYGLRLHRKLDELRSSQAGFVQAVAELDRAAARAEAGLAALRESTDTAREELADRLDSARTLLARLEQAASDAALSVKRLEAAQHQRPRPATDADSPRPSPELQRRPDKVEAPAEAKTAVAQARSPERQPEPQREGSASERLRRLTELLRTPDEPDRRNARR